MITKEKIPCKVFICVDSYRDSVPVGHVANQDGSRDVCCRGFLQFRKEIERLLSGEYLTSCSSAPRSSGKLATFAVSMACRENASWQGTVVWLERGREEHFRSVLELNSLLDGALCAST